MDSVTIETTLEHVRMALERGRLDEAIAALNTLHPADRADALGDLSVEHQADVLDELPVPEAADLLEDLENEEAAQVARRLPAETLADLLDEMEPDEAADVLGDLSPVQRRQALSQMTAEQADDVLPLLGYPDDTAGGRMTSEFQALRRQMTAQQAIDFLRSQPPDQEKNYYLYVLDRDRKLIGIVGLRELVVADPSATIESIMSQDVISVPASLDQEAAARVIQRHELPALPVVDDAGRLVGVISHDDLIDVIEEEATEDIYRLANVGSDGDLQVWSPIRQAIRRRLPWLYVSLSTGFLAAWVISRFEGTIARLAMLAVFQSVVAGVGGNAGTQTVAIIVRGIALGEIEIRHAWRAFAREVWIGVVHGIAVGVAVAIGAWLWRGIPMLGLVIGLAMMGNLIAAGLVGTLVPLTLKAFKLDPALASVVLVTTVTDALGFALFLGLATLFLEYLI